MDNNILFKALSSKTRTKMLRILSKHEKHVSGLARELGISVPVASKHIKVLEKARLLEKRKIGNVHLLKARLKSYEDFLEQFAEKSRVKIDRHTALIDALIQIPGIEAKEINGQQYITSVDGEKGFYVYEVDGEQPKIPINKFKPKKSVNVNLKKIVTVNKKKIEVKLTQK